MISRTYDENRTEGVISEIQEALGENEVIDFNLPGIDYIQVSEMSEMPHEFKFLTLRFKFLTVNVIRHKGTVLWECHFMYKKGKKIIQHRKEFQRQGFNDIQVLGQLQSDLAALYKLYTSSSQISPSIIFSGETNNTMFQFLKELSPNLIQDIIDVPELRIAVRGKKYSKMDMIGHGLLFNVPEFMRILEEANNSRGFLDLYKKLRNANN